jgi:hypothetical protein
MAISQSHCMSNRSWNLGLIFECWNQRALKAVDARTFTQQQRDDGNSFLGQDKMVEFRKQRTTMMSHVCCEVLKNCIGPAIQKKRHGILTSIVVLLHDDAHPHTAAHTRALLEHFNWEMCDHQFSLQATTHIWRTGCNHITSTIMRSWWKVSKHSWAHRQHTMT